MRIKISSLEVGKKYTALTIALLSATAKKTKAGKDYLFCELFDGEQTMTANYWDWNGERKPNNSTVLDVTGTVTEWNGSKQFTITAMSYNREVDIFDFMPQCPHTSVETAWSEAADLINSLKDEVLQTICFGLLNQPTLKQLWLTAPAAKGIHHAYVGGTLIHSVSVAKIAGAIAENTPGANRDLCVAGGLIHDIGKLYGYNFNGIAPTMTIEGMTLEHLFMGAELVGNFCENIVDVENPVVEAKVHLLRHIILSHHGKLEYGSPVTPMCIEAHIVSKADGIDSTCETIRMESTKASNNSAAAPMTEKIYAAGNVPHYTVDYISSIMSAPIKPSDIKADNLMYQVEQDAPGMDGCATCSLPELPENK